MADKDIIPNHLQVHIDRVCLELKKNFKDLLENGLKAESILEITEVCMRLIAKARLVGYEKKVVVISAVTKLVAETNSGGTEVTDVVEEELKNLNAFVSKTVDPFIDQIYSLYPQIYENSKKCLFF